MPKVLIDESTYRRLIRVLRSWEKTPVDLYLDRRTARRKFIGKKLDGPWFPTKKDNGTGNDDTVVVGKNRDATHPGIIFLDEVGRQWNVPQEVVVTTSAATMLLMVRAIVVSSTLSFSYVWVTSAQVPTIQGADDYTYFPLAWVTTVYDTPGTRWIVSSIKWPSNEWLLAVSGGGGTAMVVIQVTAAGKCSVWENGYYYDNGSVKTPDLTDQDFKVIQLHTSDTVPIGTRLWAAKFDDHYEVDVARAYG